MEAFETDRYVRAVRRALDMSQRDLAVYLGVTRSFVSRLETDPHRVRLDAVQRVLAAAGLRLVVVDEDGEEFLPEGAEGGELRDRSGRRYPAHLDVRPATQGWWGAGWPMFFGREPEYTFDRARWKRDYRRRRQREQLSEPPRRVRRFGRR